MIPVNEPLLTADAKAYLSACIDSGWIGAEGPFVNEFETKLAARVSRKHGIAVSSGSAALDIAVAALQIGPGDEVIMPAFTIISCALSVIRAGAKPVLVDADPLTWNMDVDSIASRITSKTKAIMAVHIYGLPVDMRPLLHIARKHGLKVIEDAAEAIGQTYDKQPCGSFGDVSIFSFYPNKHITTGEGGMLVTDDPVLAQHCRSLRNLCFGSEKRFVHKALGWNYRMSNLQAAVGLSQLKRLDLTVKRKREIGRLYQSGLCNTSGLQLPVAKTDHSENIYWVFGIVLNDQKRDAAHVMKKLRDCGIGSRPFFFPMHRQPVFRKMGLFDNTHFPVAEQLASQGLYLPSGLTLTNDQINKVCDAIDRILQ